MTGTDLNKSLFDSKSISRFNSKLKANPTRLFNGTACIEWQKGIDKDGYGKFWAQGKNWRAHRVSYVVNIGDVRDRLVLHKCDNPPCCNPDHLWLGDAPQNIQDKVAKNRQSKGESHSKIRRLTCARGKNHGTHTKPETRARGDRNGRTTKPASFTRGDRHHSTKILSSEILEILLLKQHGLSHLELSIVYGVSKSRISQLIQSHSNVD